MAYDDPTLQRLDRVLTNISVAFENNELVGENLAPTVTVDSETDLYNIFERSSAWRPSGDDIRAPGTKANEIPPRKMSRESYRAVEHSLMDIIPVEERERARRGEGGDPYADSVEDLTGSILMGREAKIVDMALDTGNYPAAGTTSPTVTWDDYDASHPIRDLKAGRDYLAGPSAIFRKPNVAVMGYEVFTVLEDHPEFIERIKYSQRGVTSSEIIAELTGMGRIIQASAGKITTPAGTGAQDVAYMWGKDVVLAYVPPKPGRRTLAYMYEFAYPYSGAGVMPTERWYDEDIKADKTRVSRRYDIKFIAVDSNGKSIAGYLIKDAVSGDEPS